MISIIYITGFKQCGWHVAREYLSQAMFAGSLQVATGRKRVQ